MDIVERLRRMSDMSTTGNDLLDIGRAADEIERLREALSVAGLWRDLGEENIRLKAEIERLKEERI